MGVNRSTVAALVGDLASVGVAVESVPTPVGAGRPSLVVALEADRNWALAIEVSAGNVSVARVGVGGVVGDRMSRRLRAGSGQTPAAVASLISRLAGQLLQRAPAGGHLVGVGVAVPGIVRRRDGFVHLAPNLSWREVPFGTLLSDRMALAAQLLVANEADLGAVAEWSRGAAVGARDVVYISGETGVGAGVVVGGSMLAGRSGYAGEVGHMKVNPAGGLCHCGGRGCWENEIGAPALLARAGRAGTDVRGDVAQLLEDARAGDRRAAQAVRQTAQWVGRGTASLVNIFNPDLVVFGGVLGLLFQAAEEVVRHEVDSQSLPQPGQEVALVMAGLGADSVLLGAAELALAGFLDDPLPFGSKIPR